MARRSSWLLRGLLPILALSTGCRCENLGASDCAATTRCRAIYLWEADVVKECRGDRHFRRCERNDQGGKPQHDLKELLRDDEGRYWLADPRELPEAEVQEEPADAVGWGLCSDRDAVEADAGTSGDAEEGGPLTDSTTWRSREIDQGRDRTADTLFASDVNPELVTAVF